MVNLQSSTWSKFPEVGASSQAVDQVEVPSTCPMTEEIEGIRPGGSYKASRENKAVALN